MLFPTPHRLFAATYNLPFARIRLINVEIVNVKIPNQGPVKIEGHWEPNNDLGKGLEWLVTSKVQQGKHKKSSS